MTSDCMMWELGSGLGETCDDPQTRFGNFYILNDVNWATIRNIRYYHICRRMVPVAEIRATNGPTERSGFLRLP